VGKDNGAVVDGRARSDRYTQNVFRSLGEREAALVDAMTVNSATLAANRLLVNAGEVGIGLYLVARGWAYRFRRAGNGGRQILDFLMPGEIIGLQAGLLGVIEHSVCTLTPLRASVLDARILSEAFRNEPDLALRLARYVAAEASRIDELLTVVGCCDAVERLAFLMLSLYRRQEHVGKIDPRDCPFPLRRQHMADSLGLTGAHINRTLNRLRRDGIATVENQRLSILDLPRLAALAGTPAS
jgi:CRP-like cAMP-binding protein